jgi:hypothetical protein
MVTISRPPQGLPAETSRALEEVVREALAGVAEPLDVQFSVWTEEPERPRFVCRVEGHPATPFGNDTQWRWWSALLDSPQALHEALTAGVQARRRRASEDPPSAPIASPAW